MVILYNNIHKIQKESRRFFVMATRPIFCVKNTAPFYSEINAEFEWAGGFALSQKRKNINSMHSHYYRVFPNGKVLEISSSSTEECGNQASAFNLKKFIPSRNQSFCVENVYQSSKVFLYGGPYSDILDKTSMEAKKDSRLKSSGIFLHFEFEGQKYPCKPVTAFYDYLYISALIENPELAEKLKRYDAFTDIAFNPQNSKACQARSAAIFVSLCRAELIDQVKDFQSFLAVLGENAASITTVKSPVSMPDPDSDLILANPQSTPKKDEIREGDIIIHKLFGEGTVLSVSDILNISFPRVGEKQLGYDWVLKNCKIKK